MIQEICREPPRIYSYSDLRNCSGMGGDLSTDLYSQPFATSEFGGNFATSFLGTVQSVQTDLGITYGGTLLATAGNTSTTILTLTGSLSTVPVPILVKSTNTLAIGAGAQFSISFDGGSTFAMTGVTPAVATPVPLTGAGAGLSMTWAAGTSVTNDTWNATDSAWADQSGTGNHFSQPGVTQQPIITVGVNGKPGLLFDGVNDTLDCSTLSFVAPATTPIFRALVARALSWTASDILIGSLLILTQGWQQFTGSPQIRTFNPGAGITATGLPVGTFGAIDGAFTGSVADYLRLGSGSSVTGTSSGNSAGNGVQLGNANSNAGSYANIEVLSLLHATQIPSAGRVAAWRAAVASFYGGSVAI